MVCCRVRCIMMGWSISSIGGGGGMMGDFGQIQGQGVIHSGVLG